MPEVQTGRPEPLAISGVAQPHTCLLDGIGPEYPDLRAEKNPDETAQGFDPAQVADHRDRADVLDMSEVEGKSLEQRGHIDPLEAANLLQEPDLPRA